MALLGGKTNRAPGLHTAPPTSPTSSLVILQYISWDEEATGAILPFFALK